MKITCLSDTHCRLRKLKPLEGDLLIHAGDLTFKGDVIETSKEAKELSKIAKDFTYGAVFVPGNHDWGFFRHEQLFREIMGDIKVLIDQEIIINNYKIYGSPWQPEFCNWAFNLPRGESLKEKWDLIPNDTNILITHGPPYKIGDYAPICNNVGCKDLANRVSQLNLLVHIYGHIHYSYGIHSLSSNNTKFINASICDEDYKPINNPLEICL